MTDEPDLERTVDAALRQLPAPRAPDTLMPRVMAAVSARASRPRYAQPWSTWPLPWQGASLATFALLVAGLGVALPAVGAAVEQRLFGVPDWADGISALSRSFGATAEVARVLWRVLVQPIAGCLILLVAAASMTCVATGAALARVTTGGMSR
jgi:hypothetical protein